MINWVYFLSFIIIQKKSASRKDIYFFCPSTQGEHSLLLFVSRNPCFFFGYDLQGYDGSTLYF